jgi:uncharacterized RDD family membrane protein YckC
MIKPAPYRKRALALMVDSLVALSFIMTVIGILNLYLPETEVKPMAMQSMQPKMLEIFFYSTSAITLFLGLMVFWAPHMPWGGSLGHRIAKIRMVSASGMKIQYVDSFRRFAVTIVRSGLVFFGGPVLALYQESVATSVFALIWSLIILLPVPVRRTPYPITLWQIIGNYIFIESGDSVKS